MKARFFALTVVAAGLAGCATELPPPAAKPWANVREPAIGEPGMFGDLRWNIDVKTGKRERAGAAQNSAAPANAAEQEEFKKWQESAGTSERKDFEDWRAWQEWKRQNPK